jgi:formylglycine-generating enzyme required for sulfatase activity
MPDCDILLKMNMDGIDGSSSFIDESSYNRSLSIIGSSPIIKTNNKKFGSGSAYFPNSNLSSAIRINDLGIIANINEDFTIEFWVYFDYPYSGAILGNWAFSTGSNQDWMINLSDASGYNYIDIVLGTQALMTNNTIININQWYHIAFVRKNNISKLYVNGSSELNNNSLNNQSYILGKINTPTDIGFVNPNYFKGYIDEIKIIKGLALYESDFQVPTERVPDCQALTITNTPTPTSTLTPTVTTTSTATPASTTTPTSTATPTNSVTPTATSSDIIYGFLYGWGRNQYGQLGNGTITNKSSPVQIGNDIWKQVHAGKNYTIGIRYDDTLWSWGNNTGGQLGDGTTTNRLFPVQIGNDTWKSVSSYNDQILAIKNDNTLWRWGRWTDTNAVPTGSTTPVQIGNNFWKKVYGNMIIKNDDTLWILNLKDSSPTQSNDTGGMVYTWPSNDTWKSIAFGSSYLGIKNDNTLWAWGPNWNGQLGDGSTIGRSSPVQIGNDTWKSVTIGLGSYPTSYGIKSDNTLWAWGVGYSLVPEQINNDSWKSVHVGFDYTLFIKNDNTLWGLGNNNHNQFGDGTNTNRLSISQIGSDATWQTVSIGYEEFSFGGSVSDLNYNLAIKTSAITPTPTNTVTPTNTTTPTNTVTTTSSITPTATPTNTTTPTSTLTPTVTTTSTATPASTTTPTRTATPASTTTPTNSITLTRTPNITPTNSQTPTRTATSTVTPTNTVTPITSKNCLSSIFPQSLEFIATNNDIIFHSHISDCYTKCFIELVFNNLNNSQILTENFIVPDVSSCLGDCSDDQGYKTQKDFYTTYRTTNLVSGHKYLLTASINCMESIIQEKILDFNDRDIYDCCELPTPEPSTTSTATPTISPTKSVTPTPTKTPVNSVTPTSTSTTTPTKTPVNSVTPTSTSTTTPTKTPVNSVTPTSTTTPTRTATPTATPMQTSACLLNNGDFEQGAPGNEGGGGTITSWTQNSVDIHSLSYDNSLSPLQPLNRWIDLNTCAPGYIQQSINTIIGQSYSISFKLAANNKDARNIIKTCRLSIIGSSTITQDYTFDPSATTYESYESMGWIDQNYIFTADSSTTTIKFESTCPDCGCFGPAIDNVCLIQTSANYNNCANWNGSTNGNVTTVGSNGAPSYYGTYDQSGNVYEWNDLDGTPGSLRGLRGGYWGSDALPLSSSYSLSLWYAPSNYINGVGFRLACSLNSLNLSNFVNIGNINNSNDSTGYGSVSYNYQINQYLVTNCEYVEFLNAVAKTDTYNLHNTIDNDYAGITQTGTIGNFVYFVKTNMDNKPVVFVSWFNAARYCNWLHNGKPSGPQNNSTTETGAYSLNGVTSGNAVAKNSGAKYYIPTENEWYKAAFYSPNKNGSPGYYQYATQSDTAPTCVTASSTGDGPVSSNYYACPLPSLSPTPTSTTTPTKTPANSVTPTSTTTPTKTPANSVTPTSTTTPTTTATPTATTVSLNSANFNECADWNSQNGNVTTVGSNGGPSYYGTYDQSGNVYEWNDLAGTPGSSRGFRGGFCLSLNASSLSSSTGFSNATSYAGNIGELIGLRLSSSSSTPNSSNDFVTVANTGNSNDSTGYGNINYTYQIAKYPVTNCEYAKFLTAVASTDTYNLYRDSEAIGMDSDARSGINRSGSSGNFTYTVKTNMGNKPVIYMTWFNAARYCNWLHNNKPTGPQNSSTTEDGAYSLSGRISGNSVAKNSGAKYYIPTENEWYKAAYYSPNKNGSPGYYTYATQSDNPPVCVTADSFGNGPRISDYICPT